MLREDLYASIPDVSGIEQINISESYGQTSAVATVVCDDTNLDLNSPISISIGYQDNHHQVFQGRIKNVTRSRAEGTYKLTCRDTLIDASDLFIVAPDPETPWSRTNISAEDLVGALLAEAGITNYAPNVPLSFTYAISAPIEFNFVSAMDAIGEVCRTLVWHVWDDNGTIRFSDVKPYWRSENDKFIEYGTHGFPDDPISHCLRTGVTIEPGPLPTLKPIITSIERSYSDDDLRNRVVVFGRNNISATAQVASPYLPPGFYKTAVIASQLIDSGGMANQTASFNLSRFNRLTETCQLDLLGDPEIRARQFVEINETTTGTEGYWFVETCNHVLSAGGYVTRISVRK